MNESISHLNQRDYNYEDMKVRLRNRCFEVVLIMCQRVLISKLFSLLEIYMNDHISSSNLITAN